MQQKDFLKADMYRYFRDHKLSIRDRILPSTEIKYLRIFRKTQAAENKVAKVYYRLRHYFSGVKTQIQIPYTTKIGYGFRIGHFGRIIINARSIIGNNCNISTGVVIGEECRGKRKGTPTIGDTVYIGPNAVIVGKITIGNNVLIAGNAFVNCDIPSNSVVVGNPCVIYPNDKATDGYMYNLVDDKTIEKINSKI